MPKNPGLISLNSLTTPPFARRRSVMCPYMLLGLAMGSQLAGAAHAQVQTSEAEATLPQVTVQEKVAPVTAPYAGGQVNSGGRVGLLGDKDFMETPFNTISYTEKFTQDRQAQTITDVISATDPTVFSNGVAASWSENYSIRGFSSSSSDSTAWLLTTAPRRRCSSASKSSKDRPHCSMACPLEDQWGAPSTWFPNALPAIPSRD